MQCVVMKLMGRTDMCHDIEKICRRTQNNEKKTKPLTTLTICVMNRTFSNFFSRGRITGVRVGGALIHL